jgi:hypothetical protein
VEGETVGEPREQGTLLQGLVLVVVVVPQQMLEVPQLEAMEPQDLFLLPNTPNQWHKARH